MIVQNIFTGHLPVPFTVVTTVITEDNRKLTEEIQQLKTQMDSLEDDVTGAQWSVDAYCPKKENSESRSKSSAIWSTEIMSDQIQ